MLIQSWSKHIACIIQTVNGCEEKFFVRRFETLLEEHDILFYYLGDH